MLPSWRIKLREARQAYQAGRFDEAGRLLVRDDIRDFLPAKKLASKVADELVKRGGQRLGRGDTTAGWQDLMTADQLGGGGPGSDAARQDYVTRTLQEVERYLLAGEPRIAQQRLAKLEQRSLSSQQGRTLGRIGTLMEEIERAICRGEFGHAILAQERATSLAREANTIELVNRLAADGERLLRDRLECDRQSSRLHDALAAEDYGAVLNAAEAILTVAPQHATARQAQRRAWQAFGMESTRVPRQRSEQRAVPLQLQQCAAALGRQSTRRANHALEEDTVTGRQNPKRALLWVDAVGGYLVAFDNQLDLGQPVPDHPIAVPILADLSRRHAVLHRDGGAYVLEPVQAVSVDGRPLSGPTVLASGQLIQLGDSVRIRFSKPHALSSTAVLKVESHHKTQPTADAVVLMADSCILGPNYHSHVRCPHWQHDVILFRQGDGISCRTAGLLTIDGHECREGAEVGYGSRVEGDDFSFCMEEI